LLLLEDFHDKAEDQRDECVNKEFEIFQRFIMSSRWGKERERGDIPNSPR
jgi:hypothetical protein